MGAERQQLEHCSACNGVLLAPGGFYEGCGNGDLKQGCM